MERLRDLYISLNHFYLTLHRSQSLTLNVK